jgi:folylpolyglutamate synthase/dihydropteroate synthase
LTRRSAAATSDSISAAWRAVTEQAKPGERILVVGSFVTVGEVLGVIEQGIG